MRRHPARARPQLSQRSPTPGDAALWEETIGFSKENRPIISTWRGRPLAPLRVLILAGQHGDEGPALQTLQAILDTPAGEIESRLPGTRVAAILHSNPDGCALRSRYNADGIDMNRDHQLLRSGETIAIHRFARRWRPHVILDLHSYPSRRRHLLARNVVLDHDVFIDVPSHPAILARPGCADVAAVLRSLLGAISARDVRAARYTLVASSGRARHSTPDVVDARNGLALRCTAFTILIENRQPRREETARERLRLQASQERALWAVLAWLDRNPGLFTASSALATPSPGWPVPVHFNYTDAKHGLRLFCLDARRGQPARVTLPRYSNALSIRVAVPLPAAYAVPRTLKALMALLRRHGFISAPRPAEDMCSVEKLRIEQAHPSRRPGRPARQLHLSAHAMRLSLNGYEIFPTRQTGGDALAVFLEPESKHGLHRFDMLQIPLLAPSWYPVLRISPPF